MLPQIHDVEEPQYHVVVGVVPGIPDGHILEQTMVRPKEVVRTGPHLPSVTDHAPHSYVLRSGNHARKGVSIHII